ncbi:hypothetical protein K493DRAFT_40585 [Basidiobolus meristosporus CBS 931.73]|uniref:EF-hand domain-containing protein n=1 Tax=Basidiobolus meristosporus CBS 931.73 TaxID=1314790 RepID=A0A1Y1Z5R1_9FUNG|nr:hypothetical protein K493DRAFT_40585 [Basidiobolus meristosporus CBS 931.73]|eukprot:ORY05317.1 hypothetical protein K493DRAFT_40585 [Basidiobolus meristosporus CBS 931.73]
MKLLWLLGTLSLLSFTHGELSPYEREHMKVIHGIDDSDDTIFFKLHDLNRDGGLDIGELEHFFPGDFPNGELRKEWFDEIFGQVDTDEDGIITQSEWSEKSRGDYRAANQKFSGPETASSHKQRNSGSNARKGFFGGDPGTRQKVLSDTNLLNIPMKYRKTKKA